MRLWHQDLIKRLPKQQLRGQWSEVNGMLGNGWGKKHSTVNYVFTYPDENLVAYALLIVEEIHRRKMNANVELIREKLLKRHSEYKVNRIIKVAKVIKEYVSPTFKLYREHNKAYMKECLDNLKLKGAELNE